MTIPDIFVKTRIETIMQPGSLEFPNMMDLKNRSQHQLKVTQGQCEGECMDTSPPSVTCLS